MKIYFANNSALSMHPVDASVVNAEEGSLILAGLAAYCSGDPVIMRARVKNRGSQREERFIGLAGSVESDQFIELVENMN